MFSQLVIKEPVSEVKKDGYYIEVEFEHGDADHTTSSTIYRSDSESALKLYNFLYNCDGVERDDQSEVDGYDEFQDHIEGDLFYNDTKAIVQLKSIHYEENGITYNVVPSYFS